MRRGETKCTTGRDGSTEERCGKNLESSIYLHVNLYRKFLLFKILRGILRNLKSVEQLKKFRSVSHKCHELGTKALLHNGKGYEHLRGELRLDPSLNDVEFGPEIVIP